MARTLRDANLERPTARKRLLARGMPYWRLMESGLHLGYRRTKSGGGSWIARRFLGAGKYEETSVGCGDDLQAADGVSILSFGEAQAAARDGWKNARRVDLGLGESCRAKKGNPLYEFVT